MLWWKSLLLTAYFSPSCEKTFFADVCAPPSANEENIGNKLSCIQNFQSHGSRCALFESPLSLSWLPCVVFSLMSSSVFSFVSLSRGSLLVTSVGLTGDAYVPVFKMFIRSLTLLHLAGFTVYACWLNVCMSIVGISSLVRNYITVFCRNKISLPAIIWHWNKTMCQGRWHDIDSGVRW